MISVSNVWTVPCGKLIKDQKVIEIDAEESFENASQILIKNGISSAPVYDSKSSSYVGMFDYKDIVEYVLIAFNRKDLLSVPDNEMADIKEIIKKVKSGQSVSAKNVSDLSRKNDFYCISPESPLSAALDILSENNIHRLNVMDLATGKVIGILSQSDIIAYLAGLEETLDTYASKSLKELELAKFKPVFVSSDAKVLTALSMMRDIGLSSIAVVDANEVIIGSISMSDIKYIFKYSRFYFLRETCGNFLSVILSSQGLEHGGRDRVPVLDVRESAGLDYAIKKLVATHVHRLWVIDDEQALVGVLSLTDIIKYFRSKIF